MTPSYNTICALSLWFRMKIEHARFTDRLIHLFIHWSFSYQRYRFIIKPIGISAVATLPLLIYKNEKRKKEGGRREGEREVGGRETDRGMEGRERETDSQGDIKRRGGEGVDDTGGESLRGCTPQNEYTI